MDLVVRNARLASAPESPPVDIGVAGGKIVAIQPELRAEAPAYDAGGLLTLRRPRRNPHPPGEIPHR